MKPAYSVSSLAIVLLLAYVCYSFAFSADFQLDDRSNLADLANLQDADSTIDFILSGNAGPTGRPLALASFALQADEWTNGARAFLRVNVFIHLLNALLLMLFVRAIALSRQESTSNALFVGCIAAALWVTLPLIASSTLLVVQRMTTLSACLQLLGAVVYLTARARILARPRIAYGGMAAAVTFATLLGALSKESALLLPALILVLELTVLQTPATSNSRHWKIFVGLFLVLPSLLVLAYLATRVGYPEYIEARRDFDAGERLLTQAKMLWLYLFKAVVGLPSGLGIYHDDFTIVRSLREPLALLATVAWIAVLSAAVILRRRYSFFSFAVLWFITAHLIESTVVPLELYFEHRNYIAILGPIVALVFLLHRASAKAEGKLLLVAALLIVVNTWFLYSIASLAGDSSAASRYWAYRYPNSVRAVSTLAGYQLAEEGVNRGMDTLSGFVVRHPQFAYLKIQTLNIACMTNSADSRRLTTDDLRQQLKSVQFSYLALQMLSQLATTAGRAACEEVGSDEVRNLAEGLMENPRFDGDPTSRSMYHQILASLDRQQGDLVGTARHLAAAFNYRASPDLVFKMTMTLVEAEQWDAARTFLEKVRRASPVNPLRSIRWRRNVDELSAFVTAVAATNEG